MPSTFVITHLSAIPVSVSEVALLALKIRKRCSILAVQMRFEVSNLFTYFHNSGPSAATTATKPKTKAIN